MKRTPPGKRGSFTAKSGLELSSNGPMTKTLTFGKVKYTARHKVLKWEEVVKKTVVHHLNLRNQESLDSDAVRDILEETRREGEIKQEGVAYYNKELDRYEIIDASRRRLCAIEEKVSLPLWVLDEQPDAKEIQAYIDLTQKVKRFSWREVGIGYLKHADEKGIDKSDLVALAKEFGVSKETMRKKVNAANIDKRLILSFPDSESVPTTTYAKLGKIEATLMKSKISVDDFVEDSKASFEHDDSDVEGIQKALLAHYEDRISKLSTAKPKRKTREESLAKFSNPKQYARIKTSSDGHKTTLEFSRLPKSVIDEIEELVKQKLTEI
ncbi:ParB family protein [Vibrio sp. 10N]|uniref:ParB family protein n=1 Tax=Vibrio sp. 10N TaxID=3058938 RepID=UPI00281368F5|nr:ParB family protein [Vibrio sp. 10N]